MEAPQLNFINRKTQSDLWSEPLTMIFPAKYYRRHSWDFQCVKALSWGSKTSDFLTFCPRTHLTRLGYQSEALCSASRYLNWKGLRWPTIYLYQFDGSHLELISNKQQKKTRVQLSSIAHHAPAKAHRALFHSGSNLVGGLDNKSGQRKGTFSYSCMYGHTVTLKSRSAGCLMTVWLLQETGVLSCKGCSFVPFSGWDIKKSILLNSIHPWLWSPEKANK
jgi:hypothetical protein